MGKKKKKKTKKLAKRMHKIIDKADVSFDDVVHAGVDVLVKAAKNKDHRSFVKATKRGEKATRAGIRPLADLLEAPSGIEIDDPVISYTHRAGGWYDVDVDGVIVDRVQGETTAAARAGELLESFAELDPKAQKARRTGVYPSGGGWYEIFQNGVPTVRVQGEEKATEQLAELQALNQPEPG